MNKFLARLPIMFQRLVLTFATGVGLIGLYALYSVAMRPVVVVPAPPVPTIDEDRYEEAQRPAENVRVAATYIPAQKWTMESKYMLRAEQAFVYTNAWQPEPANNKRIQFRPFAMAWVSTDKMGKEQAYSIVSDSALLEFASAFDEKNPNPGRVVRAVLNGHVEIAGPDGLAIIGRNFIFDESELNLYTTNPVSFWFQSHRGSASQMWMKMIPAAGPPGNDRPHVYGVESIRLVAHPRDPKHAHVRLEMQLPQEHESKPVNVRCAGDLLFTVAANTAIFTKDVVAWTGPKDSFDGLECDTLTMQFAPKRSAADDVPIDAAQHPQDRQSLGTAYQHIETELEFSWLEAEGQTGKHGQQVKVISKSQGVRASMTRLTYSAETRILSMTSEDADREVRVFRNRSELRVPKIEAQLGEQNLSSLICRGPGVLKYVDEKTSKLMLVATWQKQLSKRTDPETKMALIELEEGAQFRQPASQPDQRTGLIAELIKIWFADDPFNFSMTASATGTPAPSADPQPKRLLAQREVALVSPQMEIKRTNELDIRFDDENDSVLTSATQKSRSPLRLAALTTTNDVRRASAIGFASIPAVPDGVLGPPVEIPYVVEPQSPARQRLISPIVVSADRIGVRMRRIPGKPEPAVMEVQSEGKVKITQERVPFEKPLKLEGDRVVLQNEAENHEIVHVYGTPALIRDQRFEIEGKEIHLDRGSNRAWVTGSGLLKLPIPEQARIPGSEGTANRVLGVRWDESMDFDGLDAKFFGRVEAKLGLGLMHCEQMRVQLTERLPFQTTSVDTKPAVRTIHCRENVSFENSTYHEKKVIDIYRGQVGEFTWNHSTGDVVALGPGTIQAWQRQQKGGSGFAPRDTIQANRPIPVEITLWDYTRVQFEGQLKGHFEGESTGETIRQSATIDDRVEVIRGPVKRPNEKVNPDELPSGAGTMRCDSLEYVNHPKSEPNAIGYSELVGLGNSEVEGQVNGRRFTASADEISFDGSKGLYVLRGHGRQNASLTNIGTGNVIGRTILFNPVLKTLKVDRAIDGQGSQSR